MRTYAKLKLEIELFWYLNCVLMLNWTVSNRTVYLYKMDVALNNLQWLICYKTQTNQPTNNLTKKGINLFSKKKKKN